MQKEKEEKKKKEKKNKTKCLEWKEMKRKERKKLLLLLLLLDKLSEMRRLCPDARRREDRALPDSLPFNYQLTWMLQLVSLSLSYGARRASSDSCYVPSL